MDDDPNKQSFTKGNPKFQALMQECQKSGLDKVDSSIVEIWFKEVLRTNLYSDSANKFGETYFDLVYNIHNDFNYKIFKFLKHEYLNKHDEVTASINVCQQLCYKTMPKEKLLNGLRNFMN